jgi:A/G-specific adenine glycosylase
VSDQTIAAAILAHYDAHRRAMPWRETADPYAIWVSEIMLQQTRVDTARAYYERWMRRLPTTEALADSELDDVLRLWQGLGYYGRARNLHRAARVVRERFAGELPREPAELRALPGVGDYTAGAIASIAFGVPTPAVDGNVRRVLARLRGLEDPRPAEIRRIAAALVPPDRPGDFNQALMDLGATLCTPRAPDCGRCPLAATCRARAMGEQERWPRPRTARRVPEETVRTRVLLRPDGAVLLLRRPVHGFLGGLWEFPGDPVPGWVDRLAAAARKLASLDPVPQIYSHKKVTYRPTLFAVEGDARSAGDGEGDGRTDAGWAALDHLERYAMPVAQQKVAAAVRTALYDG